MFQFYFIFEEYFWFNQISSLFNVYDFNDIFLFVKLYSIRAMCLPPCVCVKVFNLPVRHLNGSSACSIYCMSTHYDCGCIYFMQLDKYFVHIYGLLFD